ncbi:MAG: hypothetical protein ABJO29_01460 [Yoonia sp.]|uniref:hypothetical protein n=1 Tax=Yoonia sp. TaxID=2212373 RepID=UPI0022095100|nr:hypothetical protein K3729_03585 [Rhodobacteraceae bacterium S2214]
MSLTLFSHLPRAASVVALLCVSSGATAQDASPQDLVAALQEGGLVIYVRHATTESDYADQVHAVMGDCATQRVLSAEGWSEAKGIGAAVHALEVPVGGVVSSGYCRAWQTADLAFGHYHTDEALHFAKAEDYSDADIAQMRENVLPFLTEVVAEGNRVVVGHDDPFEAATGIYPEPQGVAYVVRPEGDSFTVLGHIDPDAWPTN